MESRRWLHLSLLTWWVKCESVIACVCFTPPPQKTYLAYSFFSTLDKHLTLNSAAAPRSLKRNKTWAPSDAPGLSHMWALFPDCSVRYPSAQSLIPPHHHHHPPPRFPLSQLKLAVGPHTLTLSERRRQHANAGARTLLKGAAGRQRQITSCKSLSLVGTCVASEQKLREGTGWGGGGGGTSRPRPCFSKAFVLLTPLRFPLHACLAVVTECVTCRRTPQRSTR